MDAAIIPECYVDTNLIETLVPPQRRGLQKGYNHQKGCATVARTMQQRFPDSFALGIIDKDKNVIDYLAAFTEEINTGSLLLHKHRTLHHYIIQVCPAMESFILSAAHYAGLSVTDFDLPADFEQFKKECKREQSKADYRFANLFRTLLQLRVPDILRLQAWLAHLKEHTYHADLTVLRAL